MAKFKMQQCPETMLLPKSPTLKWKEKRCRVEFINAERAGCVDEGREERDYNHIINHQLRVIQYGSEVPDMSSE